MTSCRRASTPLPRFLNTCACTFCPGTRRVPRAMTAEEFRFGKYRKEHAKEIQKYEEARDWLRSFYQDGKMTSLKTLTLQKEKLQQQIASEEEAISSLKEKLKDLDTADQNVDFILQMQIPEPVRSKTKDLER